jgi:hypothetical protein
MIRAPAACGTDFVALPAAIALIWIVCNPQITQVFNIFPFFHKEFFNVHLNLEK